MWSFSIGVFSDENVKKGVNHQKGEKMPKLKNRKQELFCQEYIIDLNATQSAIRAGYSKKSAYSLGERLLKKVDIQKRLEEFMSAKASKLIAKQDEVLEFLTKALRGELKEELIISDQEGIPTKYSKEIAIKDRMKAAELLAKRYGLLTEKVDLVGDIDLNIIVDYGELPNAS